MKKRVAQWIGGVLFSALSIMIYLILFQTHLFSSVTLNMLNTYLFQPKSAHLEGVLDGAILGGELRLEHAVLLINGDTLLSAQQLNILEWGWDWDTRELSVSDISFNDYRLKLDYGDNIAPSDSNSFSKLVVLLNNVSGRNGQIEIVYKDSLQRLIVPEFMADLWLIDGFTQFKMSQSTLVLPDLISDTIHVTALVEFNDTGDVNIHSLQILADDQSLGLMASIHPGGYSASIHGTNFSPQLVKSVVLPELLSDIRVDLKLDLAMEAGILDLSGNGNLTRMGKRLPFQLVSYKKEISTEAIELQLGTELSYILLNATRDTSGSVEGLADLFRLDMSSLFPDVRYQFSEPIGTVSFNGNQNQFDLFPRLTSFMLNTQRFDTLTADMALGQNGELKISNGTLTQATNRVNFSGLISDVFDIRGDIGISDYSFIDGMKPHGDISGTLSSSFTLSGDLKEPHFTGTLVPRRLSYKDVFSLSGAGIINLLYKNYELSGDIALTGKHGSFMGDSLKSSTLRANLVDNRYALDELHIQSKNKMFSMSAGYGPGGGDIYKLNLIMDAHQLKLADTVHIDEKQNGEFTVPSTVFNFNKGGIALGGSYSQENGLDIDTQFELIDLRQVLNFIKVEQNFAGLASGSAHLTGKILDPVIHFNMALYDGVTLGYPSDSARIDLTMASSVIIGNKIEAFTKKGSLILHGQLPWGYKVKGSEVGTTPQNFSVSVKNYRLKDLNFSSVAGFPLSGRATGSISIRGNPIDTKLDGQLSLSDAAFDTLHFTKAYTEFNYEGNLLTLDSLSMVSTWGYGNGTGFIPIALDLIAPDRMRAADREMGLDFNFILNEMPFLSSYISTVDVIKGDFIGKFGLSGPLLAPIRNGSIRGHNARLELAVLGNPITDVHSEVTLIDNTLTIDHFSGRMHFSEGSNLQVQGVVGYLTSNFGELIGVKGRQKYAGTVTAQGNIDLQSFFKPRFNLTLKANEVYYRSTDGLIEAIANADMQIIGQDTTDVTAIIPVKRAVYYSNFESEESYEQLVSTNTNTLFRYSLDAQFASDLLISNDQMEAEFEGELWLLDYGDGVMRFTGTLTVLEGGKFYYAGNELALISGEIIFNSVDFNPQINMEAEISIDGERVRLILSGDLNEPELVINAENTRLTQSDVLTYLTINQKLLEEGFNRNSALDPVKTYSEMLVEKQLSKIGRDIIGLDILDVGINLGRGDTTMVSRIEVGQRLSKNLKITAAGDLQATDGTNDYDFGLEYQINQNVSVTSKINQNGEVELNGRLKFSY